MAVTRINNNQITTAVDGNAYLGVNAASKLQNYSITSNKIANSLVYGSDLTVSGNLTVNGTTTTIDTINTLIKDPIITLADGQTAGTPTLDIGVLGLRGNQNSSFLGWNEGNTEFAAVLSTTTASNTTVVISSYANFHANTIKAGGNLSVAGNIVGTANFTGNITAGNILTPGLISSTGNLTSGNVLTSGIVSATSNVTGGNLLTAGIVSATSNITGGNVLTSGLVSATANVTGGNILTAGIVSATGNLVTAANAVVSGYITATGNITGGNLSVGTGNISAGNVSASGNITAAYFIGNIQGNIDAAGANTQVQFNTTGDILGANANFTYNYATNVLTVNGGNIATGNLSATGAIVATANVTGGNLLTAGITSSTGNITTAGALNGATLSLSGNVTSALNVTGNTTSGNLLTPGIVSSTGNATAGNVNTVGLVTATGNVTGGNILTAGLISAGGNITTATNINTPNVVATGNLNMVGGNVLLTPSGNVVVNNTYINGVAQPVQSDDVATKIYVDNAVSTQIAYHQPVLAATISNLATATGGTITYNNGANGVGANITTTGSFNLIDTANVQTANTRILVKNEGNAALNGVYVWSNATVITRSTDADTYGPNSTTDLSINDYFFVQSGNVNKGAAFVVDAPTGVITFGTSNISFAQFSSSQTYTGGNGISLYGTVISTVYDNNTIGVNGSNQLYIPANATLTTPNIGAATGTSLSVTGTVTAATLSSTGNTIAGNVTTAGLVSATGNVTGGNILTVGLISATGNLTSGNISTAGLISATGNINGGNLITSNLVQGGNVSATANVIAGNVTTAGLVSATGNVTGGNILTVGLISATGNLTSGNISTAGLITATGNINGGNLITSNLVQGGNVSATANVIAGNVTTVGLITATGNVTGGNVNTAGLITATGNITGGNLITSGLVQGGNVSATANVIAGNVTTAGLISATGNLTSGNVNTAGLITATGNITGGNVTTTGTGTFGNIVLTGNNINQLNANSVINLNGAQANTNTAVYGQNNANAIFFVNASTNSASFGNSTQQTNAIVAFQTTTSIVLPHGTTAQRPSNASSQTGMIRFNTTNNGLEIYDNSAWTPVGTTTFTVIADEQFNGDGSNVAFTLGSSQTTNSCIVSINGIVQIPGTAYSVSGTYPTCVLTFTEAPSVGDLIDVREITTTTTISALSNSSGNAQITGNATAAQFDITGNMIPTGANASQSLGSSTNYWSSLYVGGNISAGNINNTNANGVGNIGSATTYFNTVFAKATSAQYADLAEFYSADAEYAPGTVVSFGGDYEVTLSTDDTDPCVAGVVSTNPSYIMNAGIFCEFPTQVALTGRVPCRVVGPVTKGAMMVSAGNGQARAEKSPAMGTVIGKALEAFDGKFGTIEIVVGRL